jgi:hypothetical protein
MVTKGGVKRPEIRVGGQQVYKDIKGNITKVEEAPFRTLGGNTIKEVEERNKLAYEQEQQKIRDFQKYGVGAEEKKEIIGMSGELGINPDEEKEIITPENIEVQTEEVQPSIKQELKEQAEGKTGLEGFIGEYVNPNLAQLTEFLTGADFEVQQDGKLGLAEGSINKVFRNAAIMGAAGGVLGFAVKGLKGGKVITSNPKKAIQLGNMVKNSAIVSSITKDPLKWAVAAYASLKTFEGFISWISKEGKISEQQTALNTIGQMATTIGGQATEAAGDYKKGLQELDYIYSEVERLGELIQEGKISQASLKYNGKIYDITADIEDQLRTIDEQRTIIRSFVLTNSFPELDELEIQGYLRDLEESGYIEPVDFTKERRIYQK